MTACMWADKDILVAPRITMFREWSICFVYIYIYIIYILYIIYYILYIIYYILYIIYIYIYILYYIYIVQDFFRMQGLGMAQEIGCRHICKQNSSLLAYASPQKKQQQRVFMFTPIRASKLPLLRTSRDGVWQPRCLKCVVRQQLSVPRRGYFEAGSHLALRPARESLQQIACRFVRQTKNISLRMQNYILAIPR